MTSFACVRLHTAALHGVVIGLTQSTPPTSYIVLPPPSLRRPPDLHVCSLNIKMRHALVSLLLTACAASPFTPGNLVVSRMGTGATVLQNSPTVAVAAPMFLDEYVPGVGGALVQSIVLPTVGTVGTASTPRGFSVTLPSQNPLLCTTANLLNMPGTGGLLTRSINGLSITFVGSSIAVGGSFNSSGVVNWPFANVNYLGQINTSTAPMQHHSGDVFYNALTVDGSAYWFAQSGSGSANTYTAGYVKANFVIDPTSGFGSATIMNAQVGLGTLFTDVRPG